MLIFLILCLVLTSIIYYIGYLNKQGGHTRPQFLVFFFASLLPLMGVMLILFTYNGWGIDYSALIMPISLLIVGYGILKYDFLEIKALARETIFENSLDGMVILEKGLKIVDYNKAAKKFFRSLNISLRNCSLEMILNRESELLEIFRNESVGEFSWEIGGKKRIFEIDTVMLDNSNDKNTRMLKTIRDITEKKKAQEQLRYLATIDALSGLYNRREFMRLAQIEFNWAKRNYKQLSLLMMDLDNFKNINDTFGHAAGDEVISKTGHIIKTSFRKTDIAGRVEGEEFAVILNNTSLEEARKVAEQFRETIAKSNVIYEKQQIRFTISIGVAATCKNTINSNSIEDTLKQADDALYKAKAKGRNCVMNFSQDCQPNGVTDTLGNRSNTP